MNSELGGNGKDTVVLDWFRPPESKTLRPVRWNYAWKRSSRALEGRPRPPYIGWCALGYKLVSIYPTQLQHGKLIRARLCCLVHQVVFMSLGPHVGRVGSTDRSAGVTTRPRKYRTIA
jgi:hypothetical protein